VTILKDKKALLLPVLSGVFLVLSFPPFNLYPLAWVSLVPLLLLIAERDTKKTFYPGLATGAVYFMGTVYWVFHSMYVYGHIPAVASLCVLILLCLYLALYTGVFAVMFKLIYVRLHVPAMFIVPVLWVTLEYARTYILTGFPWSLLGYSQHSFLPLIQISDITGVYGISFLVAAINGLVFDLIRQRKAGLSELVSRRHIISGAIALVLIIIASLVYGLAKLKHNDQGGNITVTVLQGNIDQDKKWDRNHQREVVDTYKNLTLAAASDKPDLVVWPESALPFIFGNDTDLTNEVMDLQKQMNSHMLIGSVLFKGREKGKSLLSNSVIMLSPGTDAIEVYDKIHLVPFGEYVPMGNLFPFISKMVTAVGDFVKGKEVKVMKTPFAKIGNLICYEIAFPGLVRKFIDRGTNLIVTVTNDAWFGRTSAPYQHFSMAVFRAIENRVPVARSANTGISGFIDSRGRIKKKSDIFVKASLTEKISVGTEKSFYAGNGDIFAYVCLIITSIMALLGIVRKHEKAPNSRHQETNK
jgi:apolipoprotein N-acyltransferase